LLGLIFAAFEGYALRNILASDQSSR